MDSSYKVFLNFPYDREFKLLSYALHFSVVAKGLIPVCGKDRVSTDLSRLENLFDAITSCNYSIHDLSRDKGEGKDNYIRGNMPLEAGMALFHAFKSQRSKTGKNSHRCLFMGSQPHHLVISISDLRGLDPCYHENDEMALILEVSRWLNTVLEGQGEFQSPAPSDIKKVYSEFKDSLQEIEGGEDNGEPTYEEAKELMYQICECYRWWLFRKIPAGRSMFPEISLKFKNKAPAFIQELEKQRTREKEIERDNGY